MRKRMAALLAGAMLMISATIASAYTIDYNQQSGNGGFTSAVAGALVETFDSSTPLWTWSGDYLIRNTSTSGVSAQPFGPSAQDTTNFISLPNSSSNGSATATEVNATLNGLYNYFGLWWGSVDAYNSITFIKSGSDILTITGSQAINPSSANGNQTAPSTNLYVNFYDLPTFDGFRLTSTSFAFEADNIAVAPVPEPGTMVLLGFGMLGLAIYGKRRMNKEA